MTFNPREQLEKHGWKGSGLGRNEDGMKDAIKVNIKNDHAGVGHDKGEEFTYHWWDHVFNQAANNIQVTSDQNGIKLSTNAASVEVRNKKRHSKHVASKSLLYGHFVKSATLTNDGQEIKEVNSDEDESSIAAVDKLTTETASLSKFTDEELFKKCGSLTGHKAARHGHGLSGKLARIARQEELDRVSRIPIDCEETADVPSPTPDSPDNLAIKIKKRKKSKRSKSHNCEDVIETPETETDSTLVVVLSGEMEEKPKTKKHKAKKRKGSVSEGNEICTVAVEMDSENSGENFRHASKKKKKLKKSLVK